MRAYETLREKKLPTVVYSTAEWTKFSPAVSKALGHEVEGDIEALKWVSDHADVSVPSMINDLFDKPIMHNIVVEKEAIKEEMLNFL
jgi:threonine synthase